MQGACRLRTSALLEQLSFWGYLPCLAPRSDLICLSCRCGFYVKILSNTNIKPKPYQVKKSHWLQGEKYGVSRNRGQINTWNGQALKSCWTREWGTEDGVEGSPGQLSLLKNRADTNTISGNVVSQRGFMRLLHLLQKHYSGHLDRRPPNEKGEQKSAFFIISKYLQLRDMNEKHLSCDLSGPITGEGQEKNQNPTIKPNTKGKTPAHDHTNKDGIFQPPS